MQSRIDGWKRDYFPLDIINNLIKDYTLKQEWKTKIYKRIDVLTTGGNYNIIDDVDEIEFRETGKDGSLSVYINLKENREKWFQVLTPCSNGKIREMCLSKTSQLSIDHEIPLNMIVNQILQEKTNLSGELEKIITAKKSYPKLKAKEIAERIKDKIDEDLLIQLKEKVVEDTICVLMEQSENSKKSNITSFIKYKKEGNKYILIMAEGVINPADQQKYTIYRVLNNHEESEIKMMKE